MTRLEQAFEQSRHDKYGVEGLQLEQHPSRHLDLTDKTRTPIRREVERVQELKARFKLPNGLEVQGMEKSEPTTAADVIQTHDRQVAHGSQLRTRTVALGSKQTKLWYTVKL